MSTNDQQGETLGPRPPAGRRRWLFRIAAVLVGLSPFVAFEGLCAVFDWGRAGLHDDPFVGFRSVVPLFVLNEDQSRYEIPKARQAFFRPESFAAKKAPQEFRIFCLGGSTVQGRPFAIETAFSTWLEISLRAADPSRLWEVVNCGGVSYASYRLVPILEEVLGHEPDVVQRLQSILRNARDIKQVIQKVGQSMAPAHASPSTTVPAARPKLSGKRVLVVDNDASVRQAAHALLERYRCIVETAHDGKEAGLMVRNLGADSSYDVILADVRLPDMNGYELLMKIRELMDNVPLILMTVFGYDPGHCILKARQEGVTSVLYKPFRLDQLLTAVEEMVSPKRHVS